MPKNPFNFLNKKKPNAPEALPVPVPATDWFYYPRIVGNGAYRLCGAVWGWILSKTTQQIPTDPKEIALSQLSRKVDERLKVYFAEQAEKQKMAELQAKFSTYHLSKNRRFLMKYGLRLFELLLAAAVLVIQLMIAASIFYCLKWTFDYVTDSIHHWTETRREDSRYKREQKRRDNRDKRRRKGWRRVSKVLNTGVDKATSTYKSIRGGSSVSVFDLDPATLTDFEKQQILMYYDPIRFIIKIEAIRVECQEIIEELEKEKVNGSKRHRLKQKIVTGARATGTGLMDIGSSIIGFIVLCIAATSISLSSGYSKPISNSYHIPSTSIVQIQNVEKIQEVEELIQLELEELTEVECEKSEAKKKSSRKIRKFNRKIHTLDKFKEPNLIDNNKVEETISPRIKQQQIKCK